MYFQVVLLADSTTYPVLAHAASVADVGPGTTIVHYPQRHSDESESHDEISADPSSSSSSGSSGGGGGGGVHGARGGDAQTSDPDAETEAERALAQYGFDHLVAIERAGRAFDGKFYTMRGPQLISTGSPHAPVHDDVRSVRWETRTCRLFIDAPTMALPCCILNPCRSLLPNHKRACYACLLIFNNSHSVCVCVAGDGDGDGRSRHLCICRRVRRLVFGSTSTAHRHHWDW